MSLEEPFLASSLHENSKISTGMSIIYDEKSYNRTNNIKKLFFCILIVFLILELSKQKIFTNKKQIHKTNHYPKCDSCRRVKSQRESKENSTPRDVILFGAKGKMTSLVPIVRSLRTVGCRAKIVVFTDQKAMQRYSPFFFQKMKDCGVEFNVFESTERMYTLRFKLYYKYLKENAKKIDRVIQSDLFDIMVQYDPFSTLFSKDKLYFQTECRNINDNKLNTEWMLNITEKNGRKTNFEELNKNVIINSGGQAGGVNLMIKFDEIMLKYSDVSNGVDQALQNYIFYSGIFGEETGIEPVILPYSNEMFSSIGILAAEHRMYINESTWIGNYNVDGKLPAIVHQIDRHENYPEFILRSCPNYDPPFLDYYRRK